MKIAKDNLVYIDYTIHDAQGILLNPEEGELIYLHGSYNQILPKLEDELDSKMIGDTFKITIAPEDAFGEYNEELLLKEKLSDLPQDIYVGMELEANSDDSSEDVQIFTVVDIQDEYALIDANHPLTGKMLTFEGRIMEIQELDEEGVKNILDHDAKHKH